MGRRPGRFLFAGVSWTLAVGLWSGCAPSPSRTSPPAQVPAPVLYGRADLPLEAREWIDETLASLSLQEQVLQLVFPWIPGSYASTGSEEFLTLAALVEKGIGGLSISIGLPHSYAAKLNELQTRARVPLLVTADFESGGPAMRLNRSYALPTLLPQGGGTAFPPTMAFGAIRDERFAYEYGRITAIEARAVGVHVNFAPVLDVNSNPDNPVINTRSFGEDPGAVARLGAAYIRGAHAGGVLTTAKHFPGHGDTRTDSHLELPQVTADRARLDSVELVPFRRSVDEGVDAVMTAHVSVPGVLGPDAPPATLSPYFLTTVLREEMGFGGVLFTDALRMGAITNHYGGGEAAVRVLEAGADVILAPADVDEAAGAVLTAVESGRLTRERLRASVRRILEMKARAGLHRERLVSLDGVDEVVGTGAHQALADSAASLSITLLRDRDGRVPLSLERTRSVVSLTYAIERDLTAGLTLDQELAPHFDRFSPVRVGPEAGPATYDSILSSLADVDLVLVGAYVPPRSGSGSVSVPTSFAEFVRTLDGTIPTVVLSFGNPYVLGSFPEVGTYLLAWGGWEVSQRAAARALIGERAISGRLPVSIPPHHRAGDGLRRRAVAGVEALAKAPRPHPLETAGVLPSPRGGAGEGRVPTPISWTKPLAPAAWALPAEADPTAVGIDPDRLSEVDSLIVRAIADSASPGAALAVARRGRLVRLRGYGRLDWDTASPAVTPVSLYDIASMTKVVATTTAAAMLVEEGRLQLDDPVVKYLPWWSGGNPEKEDVTVRQLLLHKGGLAPFKRFFLDMKGEEVYRRAVAALPLDYAPGDSTVYSDIGLMTVAWVVEALAGTSLDHFVEDRLWVPLGMSDTGFRPDPGLRWRIAPTEVDSLYRRVHVHGVVHDENAYAMGGVAGHAGLFSSARDLAVFAQMMLDEGSAPPCDPEDGSGRPCHEARAQGIELLQAVTVAAFTGRHDEHSSRALGWDTPSPGSSSGDLLSSSAFGHTGFTGTSIWIDPELDLFVVLLTNRVNTTRENSRHVALRRAVHDAVARAVLDRPAVPGGD